MSRDTGGTSRVGEAPDEPGAGFVARRTAKGRLPVLNPTKYVEVNSEGPVVQAFDGIEMVVGSDDEGELVSESGLLASPGGAKSEEDAWYTNIWAPQNVAIVMSYFCVGMVVNFLSTPLSYYLVHELDATPAQQNVIYTVAMLPWSFKLLYGFVSDNFPIRGRRRKPYFIMGWGMFVVCILALAAMERPSVDVLAGLCFLATVGYVMSDVATDAIVVERSKHEHEDRRGHMQATGYSARAVGSLLGSSLGTLLYNKDKWGWGLNISQVFFLDALIPIVFMGPFMGRLQETGFVADGLRPSQRVRAQCWDVFAALSQRAVYVPMSVVFVYNFMMIPNAAWRSFLVDGLEFSNFQLGLLSICGSLFTSAGILTYKAYFMGVGWRKIYVVCTTLNTAFSVVQLLLIFRVNLSWGISDILFAIGDDSITEFILAIQFLPVVQMYIAMCPEGSEGTTYAILTTLSNVAYAVAYNIGTLLTGVWDVSNTTLQAKDYSGMWRLTLLTSLVQWPALLLIGYLPSGKDEQKALQQSGRRSWQGGTALLTVLFASLGWTILESVWELT